MNLNRFHHCFKLALLGTLFIRFYLAWRIPLTGDEAYFALWGKHLDFGYYDHPPLTGWLLHFLLYISAATWFLRLPAVLLPAFLSLGIYALLKEFDPLKACLVALLFLISPINVLNIFITTDTTLIFFTFLSVAALTKALEEADSRRALLYYALSGSFLGLAFLSKYFAILLAAAYVLYCIFTSRNEADSHRKLTQGFVLLFLCALPLAAINLYWNYTHCWANVTFNFYNRTGEDAFSVVKPLLFVAIQLYLATPFILYYLARHRSTILDSLKPRGFRLFAFAFVIPLAVLAALSLNKIIGLHWALAFYPFFIILLGCILTDEELVSSLKLMFYFTLAHLLIIILLLAAPLKLWRHSGQYEVLTFVTETDEIAAEVHPYEGKFHFATTSYALSAILAYHYAKKFDDRNFAVFGKGSYHGRQDDISTDFRKLNGQNILILGKSSSSMPDFSPYFQAVQRKRIVVGKAAFPVLLGYLFKYPLYKARVLRDIKARYYRVSHYLPQASCYFCEKYFDEKSCAR